MSKKQESADPEWGRKRRMTVAEQVTESTLRKCIHFTGMLHKACKVGVVYLDVLDETRAYPDERMPCFRGGPPTCDRLQFPTQEEAEAAGREAEDSSRRLCLALLAVIAVVGKQRGVHGSIPCPCCETGKLHYSVSGYNGHIWGSCSTQGCVRWMQ